MKLKKLVMSTACMMFAMCMMIGCAKDEKVVNQESEGTMGVVESEMTTEIGEETSVEESVEVTEQTDTATPETAETIDPDDIKLRNVFAESFAESVILPAEPAMSFDEDVKLDMNQLTLVETGNITKNLGELTTEDLLAVGYVDAFGNEVSLNEEVELIGAAAKGYAFDAYYDGNIIDRIYVIERDPKENSSEITMKFTECGIQVGEESETLKQLGVPALTANIDGDMYYYWQIENEEGGCCLCVQVTDTIIRSMEIMIF